MMQPPHDEHRGLAPPHTATWELLGPSITPVGGAAAAAAATEPADCAAVSSSNYNVYGVPAAQQPTDASDTHALATPHIIAAARKQQRKGDSVPLIYAACRWRVSSAAWLLSLLSLLLFACMGNTAQGYVSKLLNGLCDLLLQKPPYREEGTVYYRLGRVHRSPRPSSDNAGRKPWLRAWHLNNSSAPSAFQLAGACARHQAAHDQDIDGQRAQQGSRGEAALSTLFALHSRVCAGQDPVTFVLALLAAFSVTSTSALQLHTRSQSLGYNPLSSSLNPCPTPRRLV
jgi:hypothetical protein